LGDLALDVVLDRLLGLGQPDAMVLAVGLDGRDLVTRILRQFLPFGLRRRDVVDPEVSQDEV
jgi:hypothetical protein